VAEKLREKGHQVFWFGHKYSMIGDENPSAEFLEVSQKGIPFVEIRAGIGGKEAALFVSELFKMYSKYAAGSANWNVFQIRKNGTTPTYVFECAIPYNFAVESQHRFCVIIGLDTGQVIEYKIDVGTDCTISCTLDAMGYVE